MESGDGSCVDAELVSLRLEDSTAPRGTRYSRALASAGGLLLVIAVAAAGFAAKAGFWPQSGGTNLAQADHRVAADGFIQKVDLTVENVAAPAAPAPGENLPDPSPPPPLHAPIALRPWEEAKLKAREVDDQMTDEERIKFLTGDGFLKINYWVGTIKAIPRLGIPSLKLQDSSGGFRPTAPGEFGTVTSWPSSLSLAATWDENSVTQVAAAIATEFRGKGANVLLGPGVNVHRSPYGGRNFEYLSGEDPYLGARLAAAYVRAVQGEGVMAVAKHWAFNEQETQRAVENSVVGERTAWEIYYPPFEAAVEAGAGAFMCSYNRVNGTYACENDKILRGDLKGAMGFSGFVMSDWHAAMSANVLSGGMDMEQPDARFMNKANLKKEKKAHVHEAAQRILAAIYRLRIDENPGCVLPCEKERASNQRTMPHVQLAKEGAEKGIVLLKNSGVLPLSIARIRTVAVIGPAANARDSLNTWGVGSPYSGGGSGHVPSPFVVSPLEGIQGRAKTAGITVMTTEGEVTDGCDADYQDDAFKVAETADVVIVVGGTTATENSDRTSLAMDGCVDDLITKVARTKPTIVLAEVPGTVTTPWRNDVAAIAVLFTGGEQTGSAWASVLFGDVAPSGRLPITLPASDVDAIKPGTVPGGDVRYTEGLFSSYRSASLQVAFPFGHGLTYTKFEYGEPVVDPAGCMAEACVRVTITNTGSSPGTEVAQAYLQFEPGVQEPLMVLRGFQRTRELQPGETEELHFAFTSRDLSTYVGGAGPARERWQQHEWVVLHLGSSSADIRRRVPIHSRPRTTLRK